MIRSSKNVWFIGVLLTGALLVASLLVTKHALAQKPETTVANEDGTYTTLLPYGEDGTTEIVTSEGKVISVVHKDKDGKPLDSKDYRESTKEEIAKKEEMAKKEKEEMDKKEWPKGQAANGAAQCDPLGEEYPGRKCIACRTWEYDSSGRLVKFSETFPDHDSLERTIEYSDKNDTKGTSKDETVSVDDAFKAHRKPADAKEISQINKDIKLDPVREYSPDKRKFHSIVDDIREEMPKEEKQKKEAPKQETPTKSIINDLFPKEETSKTPGTGMPTPIPTPTPQPNPPPKNTINQAGYLVGTNTANGLFVTTFDTPQGKIKINLTDDVAASDTISGTVETEPAGKSDAERAQNLAELNGDVIELEGQKIAGGDKRFTCTVPALLTSDARTITLQHRGQRVATSEILISSTPLPTPTQFILPTGGQQGRPIEITGPFNGRFSPDDYVRLGATMLPEKAEDPRKKIVLNTDKTIGPSNFECKEGGVTTKGSFRNIGVALSAPKTNLLRGEQTTLSVTVSGLQGIQQNVPVHLQNNSTSVLGISGGDIQDFDIPWAEVTSNGTWNRSFTMIGRNQGVFNITATAYWKNPTNPDGNNTAGQAPPPNAGDAVNVSGPVTSEQLDALRKKRDEKRKAYDAAAEKSDAAVRAALASADQEKVKAYEQARKEATNAAGAYADAYDKYNKDKSDANKRALEDTGNKFSAAQEKERAADKAMWDSMDPDKRKAMLEAYREVEKPAHEYLEAKKEFEDAWERFQKQR